MNNIKSLQKIVIFIATVTFVLSAVYIFTAPITNAYNNHEYSNHGYDYPSYQVPVSPLGISCNSTPTYGVVGETISWISSPYGGTGNYYVTWSGNDGLSGYGTNITKVYNNSGSKYASVTVTSGNQTASANCGNNVNIRDVYQYNPIPVYPIYTNYPTYSTYTPLYVSCYANNTYSNVNSSVTWSANASGGNGSYSYSWSGTESMYGSGSIISTAYRYAGIKSASVTVYSNGQSITQSCSNTVNVYDQNNNVNYNYSYNNNIVNNNSNNIQVACYADKTSAKPGAPVTWSVEATGATGNFTYKWSGSENLNGNMFSVVKTYDNVGTKTATVSVTSSNGQSATQICGNSVNVANATVYKNTNTSTTNTNTTNTIKTDTNNDNSAAALFSLKHIPWGWVAILIILILIITVIYLIYNRNKI